MTVQRSNRRLGSTVVLVAVLMAVLLAIVALSVDVGYLAVVRTEMQNASDAASLAAAANLPDRDELKGEPDQSQEIQAARYDARRFAARNQGSEGGLWVDRNESNDPEGDVVVGHIARPWDHSCPMTFDEHPYNSVRVRTRRNSAANGPVGLFFGRIFGKYQQAVEATATSTIEGNIKGFKIKGPNGARYSKLLPYTLDVNVWTDQITNRHGRDDWHYDPETGAVRSGSDGIPEVKLFPNKGIASGNFGTIDIGAPGNSTSQLARQILYGPNEADFAYYPEGEFKLGSDLTLVTGGDTGVSAGVKDELESIIGQPRIIPLYRPPVVGNGNNARFTIVAFVGIVITEVELSGSMANKHMTIQPEFVIDATAMSGGNASTSKFVVKPVKLTR